MIASLQKIFAPGRAYEFALRRWLVQRANGGSELPVKETIRLALVENHREGAGQYACCLSQFLCLPFNTGSI